MIRSLASNDQWRSATRAVQRHPAAWVAQRRFEACPIQASVGPIYPCIGVYTVNGCPKGIYGRFSYTPVIDFAAVDVAISNAHGPTACSGITCLRNWGCAPIHSGALAVSCRCHRRGRNEVGAEGKKLAIIHKCLEWRRRELHPRPTLRKYLLFKWLRHYPSWLAGTWPRRRGTP